MRFKFAFTGIHKRSAISSTKKYTFILISKTKNKSYFTGAPSIRNMD